NCDWDKSHEKYDWELWDKWC
nr:Chain A, Adhesin WI-1 [Blastomyces dermatitidis ER-3]